MPRKLSMLTFVSIVWMSHGLAEPPANPFARPVLESQSRADEAPADIARPELRGVVAAGPSSVANLNGILLSIGEESSGYELESVTEHGATFRHKGDLITLALEDATESDR